MHADYAIERESPYAEYFARALVVAMRSVKESDPYPLDKRRLNRLHFNKELYLNLELRTNREVIGRLAVAVTGYVQVIVLVWVAGEFSFAYSIILLLITTCECFLGQF